MNPLASNPTKPWFLIRRDDGGIETMTQTDPGVPVPYNDIVPAEWPAADDCGRKRPHAPHTWGGDGWSDYRCQGRGATP